MSKKKRRRFTAEQKAEVLRRLLFKKAKVADLAEEYEVQPSMIYRWQQAAEANLVATQDAESHASRKARRERQLEAQLESLKARLRKKDEVIAELSEEYVTLKKSAGNR